MTIGSLLFIEPNPESLTALLRHVKALDYEAIVVSSFADLAQLQQTHNFDLILASMELLEEQQDGEAQASLKDATVIILGLVKALETHKLESYFKLGICDYLTYDCGPRAMSARLSSGLERRRQEQQVQTQKELLKYERELQIGRQIQLDFLPDSLPKLDNWEILSYFSPARDVAGDFYDSFLLSNGRVGLVLADVCDKGVGAALFMALFRSLIRSLSQQNYSLGVLDFLSDDKPMARTQGQGRRVAPSAGTTALRNTMTLTNNYIANTHSRSNMFATIFFGILDPVSGTMIYINGGHEPLIWTNREGEIKGRLQPTGPAVGMLPDMTFDIEQVQLEVGDMLLAYTDGVTEAHDLDRKLFSEARLLDIVKKPKDSAQDLLDQVVDAVRNHIGEAEQFDDITMLAVHRL